MNLRQKKYIQIKNVYNFFKNNNIFLFVHVNNMNIIENKLIKSYCNKNNVTNINLKINVIKKITTNNFFLNLFAGPTQVYSFNNFENFLNFFQNPLITRKIVPLTVFWDNKFFSYPIFKNYLENYKQNNKSLAVIINEKNNFLVKITNKPINLISNLNNNSLLLLLQLYILKNQ